VHSKIRNRKTSNWCPLYYEFPWCVHSKIRNSKTYNWCLLSFEFPYVQSKLWNRKLPLCQIHYKFPWNVQ
jgi:hypothetical protein